MILKRALSLWEKQVIVFANVNQDELSGNISVEKPSKLLKHHSSKNRK